jgi:hemolysin activation/secretion protein
VSAGLERLWFDGHPETTRFTLDARGFVGLLGSNVLALRALHSRTGSSVPVYEQALLGAGTLRGFPLGFRYGDRLAAVSMEYRIPFTSPLRAGRFGAAMFVDSGTVYSAGESLDSAVFDTGVGGGLFMQAPLVSFRADVAHGLGGSTRVHVGLGVSF